MRVNRRHFLSGAVGAAGASLVLDACDSAKVRCDPAAPGPCAGLPDGAYFTQLAQDLTDAGLGTPQMLIDLDRLDANADLIAKGAGAERYRIVEKSLPSIDLLSYISARTGSNRFLVLHLPFLPAILDGLPSAQVLVGKPQPIAAVKQFFAAVPAAQLPTVAARVRFLADTVDRINGLVDLAKTLSLTLQVGVEVDIGLHRGGARTSAALADILSVFASNRAQLSFVGLLGYDGHVANAPAGPGLDAQAARATFKTATATYQAFVDVLNGQFPSLVRDDLIFNSGGTATYPLYTTGPVNDVAAGGGMLRPAAYASTFLGPLAPASFIAAPVLAHSDTVDLPVIGTLSQTVWSDQQCFTIYGGGWAAEFVWPDGISLAPLVNDAENLNLVPNQAWLVGPSSPPILPGDWVFQHPRQADALFQFERLLLVRGGRLQRDSWRAFPRRY